MKIYLKIKYDINNCVLIGMIFILSHHQTLQNGNPAVGAIILNRHIQNRKISEIKKLKKYELTNTTAESS